MDKNLNIGKKFVQMKNLQDNRQSKSNQEENLEKEPAKEEQTLAPKGDYKQLEASMKYIAFNNQLELSNKNLKDLKINDGVSKYRINKDDVTIYKHGDDVKIQVISDKDVDFDSIYKRIPDVLNPSEEERELEGDGDGAVLSGAPTSVVNGEIDEWVEQGGTGDCWLLVGVLALNSSEDGRAVIKESIHQNSDGSVTVTFKGVGVSYTISAAEIKKYDTDNNKSDAYSNGDNDMLVLELAVEKLKTDILKGVVKLDVSPDSYEGYNPAPGFGEKIIEGGFPCQLVYFLTGKVSDNYVVDTSGLSGNAAKQKLANGLSKEDVYKVLQQAIDKQPVAISFGMYYSVKKAKLTDGSTFSIDLRSGGHALAITKVTQDTVTIMNPWDSTKEYTMTWEEFAKMGIGMMSIAQLDKAEVTEPAEPEEPEVIDLSGLDNWAESIDFSLISDINKNIHGQNDAKVKAFKEIDKIKAQIVDYVKNQLSANGIELSDEKIENNVERIISQQFKKLDDANEQFSIKDILISVMQNIDNEVSNSESHMFDKIQSRENYTLENTDDYYLSLEEKELKELLINIRKYENNHIAWRARISIVESDLNTYSNYLKNYLVSNGVEESIANDIVNSAKETAGSKIPDFGIFDIAINEAEIIYAFVEYVENALKDIQNPPEPVEPEEPDIPDEPDEPDIPDVPDEPEEPEEPEEPGKDKDGGWIIYPYEPVGPGKPGKPGNPDNPKPFKPINPDNPKPFKPDIPDINDNGYNDISHGHDSIISIKDSNYNTNSTENLYLNKLKEQLNVVINKTNNNSNNFNN